MDLYPHNRKAYERLLPMLEECGRACIVHPTGTGKSLIGYEYVEQHLDEQILWLGPSDYIFAEQEAALARLGAGLPANLLRMTYQKLLADLKQGAPMPSSIGCVILDEFHRCGAPRWSEGVGAVLAANPGCKVIGFSATPIRYCDGGRDMAKELFDGHIASEMTLPEAWTAGLLPKPVYVTSLFSMDGEFDRQLARIDDILDEDNKEEVLKTYWEMRRTLQAAGGLPCVFERHLKKPDARVIVFCPDRKALDEQYSLAGEWFALVNRDVHAYRVHSANPNGEVEMARFKADESDALKVLYCIDQLNEGVHVKGIDAVVMARPTGSPIIYLQQLGRCLDADGAKDGKEPVVFDLSNNLWSLEEARAWLTSGTNAGSDVGGGEGEGEGDFTTLSEFKVFAEERALVEVGEIIDEACSAWKDKPSDEMIAFLEEHHK